MPAFVAVDLGAESGRVIVADLVDQKIELNEVHRFPHSIVEMPTGLHWDITGLWREIVVGLKRAASWAKQKNVDIVSVGVDTWGVDWCLVTEAGELCGLPHAYRDPRNLDAFSSVVERLGADKIYQQTGIQLMAINSLYSLYAQRLADPSMVQTAHRLMFIPDLFHYWLSGEMSCEHSIASTSQMLDVHSGEWAKELFSPLDLPVDVMLPVSKPGTAIGPICERVVRSTGLSPKVKVVLPPSHDTASAIAAVPVKDDRSWAYLSSGTWSLLGAEIDEPCVSAAAKSAMFTNEAGVDGTIRFLKNIAGLWLVQQCRADWTNSGESLSYTELTLAASESEPFRTLVDPDHPPFCTPGDMCAKINDYARASGQPMCETHGQFVRCCLESLAMAYRKTLETLQDILTKKFDVLHIVGGGGQNLLLDQMTAGALGIEVVVGPYEATAIGNGLVQAMAAGEIANLKTLREVVCNSFEPRTFYPSDVADWDTQYMRFREMLEMVSN